jgi:hypothetical protein
VLPNFLIIGAARSGTTSLYAALQQHRDVYLPRSKRPEPHFFLKEDEFQKGLSYYEQRYFSEWDGQNAVGEASTSYLYGPRVPARVAAALPDVRLLCLLRNPIERAYSGYWHSVKSGLEQLSFDDAIAREPDRKAELAGTALGEIAPFAYIERGLYFEQLQRWYAEFDRSRVLVLVFDDLIADPATALDSVARFLNIDRDAFTSRELGKENRSVPEGNVLPAASYRALADRFRPDVAALERLLDRDLSNWLSPP